MRPRAAINFWNGTGSGELVRLSFYVLLAAFISVELARSALNAARFFKAPGMVAGVSSLDSFSDSATAAMVLKREAESLLFDYTRARDGGMESKLDDGHSVYGSMLDSDKQRRLSPIHALERFNAIIQSLSVDSEEKLLLVYSENGFDEAVVQHFLRLLQTAPECAEVLQWMRCALDCSRRCGRTLEVQDALRHIIRFHPSLKTTGPLEIRLQNWAENQNSVPSNEDE